MAVREIDATLSYAPEGGRILRIYRITPQPIGHKNDDIMRPRRSGLLCNHWGAREGENEDLTYGNTNPHTFHNINLVSVRI
jgi:hypothetical protein